MQRKRRFLWLLHTYQQGPEQTEAKPAWIVGELLHTYQQGPEQTEAKPAWIVGELLHTYQQGPEQTAFGYVLTMLTFCTPTNKDRSKPIWPIRLIRSNFCTPTNKDRSKPPSGLSR